VSSTETFFELPESDEDAAVAAWRSEQLERLGISRYLAGFLATVVDWHEVAALVARGCPVELAVEIVR
jgi:hypothetical protein